MIVFNKYTGKIIGQIPNYQDPYFVLREHPDVKSNSIGAIITDAPIVRTHEYYIENNDLVKYNELELSELIYHGKVLSQEERELNKLRPSIDEIKKAENTIEILSLLSEVL